MDFQQEFLNALQTGTALTKTISILDYLPLSVTPPELTSDDIPYVQSYGNIIASYPYYYEISELASYCLIYTESGTGTLTVSDRAYLLPSNSLAFIDCSKKHRIEIRQSQWNYKVFFINGGLIPSLYHVITAGDEYVHNLTPESAIHNMIKRLYTQLAKDNKASFLQTKIILDIFMEKILEMESQKEGVPRIPEYLIKIKNDFDTNYQRNFSLDSLEQEYHISKYRLCREFTEAYSSSPIQYLNYRRIEAVKEALVSTDKRINEIGRMVGFENTNLFIRLFKKHTGLTPLNYRKSSPVFTYFH